MDVFVFDDDFCDDGDGGFGGILETANEDLRHNAPLRMEPYVAARDQSSTICANHQSVAETLKDWYTVTSQRTVCYPGVALKMCLDCEDPTARKHLARWWREHVPLAQRISVSVTLVRRQLRMMGLNPRSARPFLLSERSEAYLAYRWLTDDAVRRHVRNGGKHQSFDPSPVVGVWQYVVVGKSVFWNHIPTQTLSFEFGDSLRAAADLLCMRAQIYLAIDCGDYWDEPGLLPRDICSAIFRWGDQALRKRGNAGFKIVKHLEPLVTGRLIELLEDDTWHDHEFMKEMIESLRGEARGDQEDMSILDILRSIEKPSELTQAFGLFRCWSHPVVDTQAALTELRTKAQHFHPTNRAIVDELTATFIDILYTNYRRSKGVYPPTHPIYLPDDDPVLLAIEHNGPVDRSHQKYHWKSWLAVRPMQSFAPAEIINDIKLLSDKATSLRRSAIEMACSKGHIPGTIARRLINAFIMDDHEDVVLLLERINREGLPDEDLTIGLTAKERELKNVPRTFSIMPLNLRRYITATEALIAECVLPWIPEITMGISGTDLIKRMLMVTRGTAQEGGSVRYVVNLDFAKWNQHQRADVVNPIFTLIDGLFGYEKVISRTHDFFTRCRFYRADNFSVPSMIDYINGTGPSSWTFHLGGLEGLRQKGWTIVTAMLLIALARRHGLRLDLLAQGDNQVLLVDVPRPYASPDRSSPAIDARVKATMKAFVADLERVFGEIGMPLKKEESWVSTKMFAYGKTLIAGGAVMPMSLKRISRVNYANNDDFPCFTNQIAGIYAAAAAACETGATPVTAYHVAVLEHAYAMDRALAWTPSRPTGLNAQENWPAMESGRFGKRRYLMSQLVAAMVEGALFDQLLEIQILVGTPVGGYGTQFLASMLSRGFPDPLTATRGFARRYLALNTDVSELVAGAVEKAYQPRINDESADMTLLAEDPAAVNIVRPPTPRNALKANVKELLTSAEVKNPLIQVLAKLDSQEYRESLTLGCQMLPFLPRLLSLMADCSPSGLARAFLAAIESTRSVQKFARKTQAGDALKALEIRLAVLELEQWVFYLDLIARAELVGFPGSDVAWADKLRRESWGSPSLSGVTINHPINFMDLHPCLPSGCAGCKSGSTAFITIALSHLAQYHPRLIFEVLGCFLPYLGSTTRKQQTSGSEYSFEVTQPALMCAMTLAALCGWSYEADGLFSRDVDKRIQAITDVPLDILRTWASSSASAALHRLGDLRTEHGGFVNALATLFTHLSVSTSTMGDYSHGVRNYALHFQHVMVIAQSLVSLRHGWLRENVPICAAYHFHVTAPAEVPVADEARVEYPDAFQDWIRDVKYQSHPEIPSLFAPASIARPHLRSGMSRRALRVDTEQMMRAHGPDVLLQQLYEMALSRSVLVGVSSIAAFGAPKGSPTLDFIWYAYMKPVAIIEKMAWHWVCASVFVTNAGRRLWPGRRSLNSSCPLEKTTVIEVASLVLASVSDYAFEGMAPLVIHRESRKCLSRSLGFAAVEAFAPSHSEACQAIRRLLAHFIRKIESEPWRPPATLPFPWGTVGAPVSTVESCLNVTHTVLKRVWQGASVRIGDYLSLEGFFRTAWISPHSGPKHSGLPPWILPLMGAVFEASEVRMVTDLEKPLERVLRDRATRSPTTPSAPVYEDRHIPQETAELVLACSRHTIPQQFLMEAVRTVGAIALRVGPSRHVLRPAGVSSTTSWKVLPILEREGLVFGPETGCIMLADGAGGLTGELYARREYGWLFFNTLVGDRDLPESSISELGPSAAELLVPDSVNWLGEDMMRDGPTDITLRHFADAARSRIGTRRAALLCCDAEGRGGDWTKVEGILRTLLGLGSLLRPDGILCWKCYGSRRDHLVIAVSSLSSSFDTVKLYRSLCTSENSTELYVVCKGWRGSGRLNEFHGETAVLEVPANLASFAESLPGGLYRGIPSREEMIAANQVTRYLLPQCWGEVCYRRHRAICDAIGLTTDATERQMWDHLMSRLQRGFVTERDTTHLWVESSKKVLSHGAGEVIAQTYVYLLSGMIARDLPERVELLARASRYWSVIVEFSEAWRLVCVPGDGVQGILRQRYIGETAQAHSSTTPLDYVYLGVTDGVFQHKSAGKWFQEMWFTSQARYWDTAGTVSRTQTFTAKPHPWFGRISDGPARLGLLQNHTIWL